jgi:hypothetical protein
VPDTDYRFRIRAKNVYGFALFYSHPEVLIKSSGIPYVMPSLSTEYDTIVPTSVKIFWDAAFDNYETIDAYQILIKQADGTFTESLAECDGSTAQVLAQLYCYVMNSSLRSSPYSLTFDNLVIAKIRAHNVFGWSEYSPENIAGAYIQIEPLQISSISMDILTSDLTILDLSWPALTTHVETGGTAILSYQL